MRLNRRGFTLIELLIVVAIIGIIVAISVINLLSALHRARQKRTMGDMKAIATAIEAYQADTSRYPPASAFTLPSGLSLPTLTTSDMSYRLSPTYIKSVPLTDGWNSWFTYATNTELSDYVLRSNGRDGIPETTPIYGKTTAFNDDIIFIDGVFVQYPEGVQN